MRRVSVALCLAALLVAAQLATAFPLYPKTKSGSNLCDASADAGCDSKSKGIALPTPEQFIAYNMFAEFITAVQDKNYTGAESLLSDAGNYAFTDVLCGELSKSQFMDVIKNAKVSSFQLIPGEWTEVNGDFIVMRVELSVIFGADYATPYSTFNDPNVFIVVQITKDKKQMYSIQVWTDSSARQTNSSLMLNAFNTAIAATTLRNVEAWSPIMSPGPVLPFTFALYKPFDDNLPLFGKAKDFLSILKTQYGERKSATLSIRHTFITCEYVASDMSLFTIDQDGNADVHKLFVTLRMKTEKDTVYVYFLQVWYLGRA